MRLRAKQAGFSFTEALVVLAIIGLMAGQSVPDFFALIERQNTVSAVHQLISAIRLTRHSAMTHGTASILCPWDVKTRGCGQNWRQQVVFVDHNNNRLLDADDKLVRLLPPLPEGSRVYFRSFARRQQLRASAQGLMHYQNGHFLYCPPTGKQAHTMQIILNSVGRIRTATDQDADGIAEDSAGNPLSCPKAD